MIKINKHVPSSLHDKISSLFQKAGLLLSHEKQKKSREMSESLIKTTLKKVITKNYTLLMLFCKK